MSKIKKYWYIPVILLLLVIIIWKPPTTKVDTHEIEVLQSKIDSINSKKDSIDQRIDTITLTIEKNHIKYEKDIITILGNNTSEDYLFFTDYINRNKTRLDSISNL